MISITEENKDNRKLCKDQNAVIGYCAANSRTGTRLAERWMQSVKNQMESFSILSKVI